MFKNTELFGKPYHWAKNKRGALVIHRGDAKKCRRVHCRDQ